MKYKKIIYQLIICFYLSGAGCSLPVILGDKAGNIQGGQTSEVDFTETQTPPTQKSVLVTESGKADDSVKSFNRSGVVPPAGDTRQTVEINGPRKSAGNPPKGVSVLQAPVPTDHSPRSARLPHCGSQSSPPGTDYDSKYSYHNKILTEDVYWSGKVVIKGALTIAAQATLTIGPGTVVYFFPEDNDLSGGVLLVHGRIVGNATSGRPILFKSAAASKKAPRWQGIALIGSKKNNFLEHCRVEGAVAGLDVVFSTVTLKDFVFDSNKTGIRAQYSQIKTTGGSISACDIGFDLLDSNVEIRKTSISANDLGLKSLRSTVDLTDVDFSGNVSKSLESRDSKMQILNSRFTGNGSGPSFEASAGSLEGNKIASSRGYGVRLVRSKIRVSGNVIARNSVYGIVLYDGCPVIWGNDIFHNGKYDLFYYGLEDIRAVGNWWGTSDVAKVKKRIYDKLHDTRLGRVFFYPSLQAGIVTTP